MKRFNGVGLLAMALLFAACGGEDVSEPVAAPEAEPVTTITITGNDRMQFDITEFSVPAGEEITIIFENIGKMPKEAMGHNLVVLQRDMEPNVFSTAATRHPANEYIPPEYEEKVIAATAILGPGESEALIFSAPTVRGAYPYVCSFPGHTAAGMKGVMTVQ